MKKTILTFVAVGLCALSTYGQGRINFNNLTTPGVGEVTIGTTSGPAQGLPGQYVGAEYNVQLLWLPGAFAGTAEQFLAQAFSSSAIFEFFGATGGNPGSDGAGLFDGGVVPIGPAGQYSLLEVVWHQNWNTFAEARGNGTANVGWSDILVANVTASPTPAGNTTFASFTVQPIPEPSTFALAGLGAAAMLIIRRRK